MILTKGAKIHVIHRPLFDNDVRRHFIGEVDQYEEGVALVEGYLYTIDAVGGGFIRRPGRRTRVVPLCGQTLINVLPHSVNIEEISYSAERGFIHIKDNTGWTMDISYE
jgi:hypothetical protein